MDWVLIIFGTQVKKKKRPVRPVFPDFCISSPCYLSVSYDYGNTNFKIEVVSTKENGNIKIKIHMFHVIPFIHSSVMGLFSHISMATMTTFSGTSLTVKKKNWIE